MDAARWIRSARERAGLSKRELARRARTSPAAVIAYESGARDPTVGTLRRLLAATGTDLEVAPTRRPDPHQAAARLEQVLDLADALPYRPERHLPYPRFPT
jgi:transcriptional regulator with XRE-family HTH domain